MAPHLLSLPKEVRLNMMSYLVPRGATIPFEPVEIHLPNKGFIRKAGGRAKATMREVPFAYPAAGDGTAWMASNEEPGFAPVNINSMSIFLVCRHLYEEAFGLLYRTNTYRLTLGTEHLSWGGYAVVPARFLQEERGSKPLLPVIRPTKLFAKINQVELVITEDLSDKDRFLRVKRWMLEIADRLGAHRTLQRIKVNLTHGNYQVVDLGLWQFFPRPGSEALFQYCLEPLAHLHGIPSVDIVGHVSPGFAAELTAAMQRKSCDIGPWDMPRRAYKSDRELRRTEDRVWRQHNFPTSRFFYEPELDWNALSEDLTYDDRFAETRTCRLHASACTCNRRPVFAT